MKDLNFNINNSLIDSISKFNFYNKKILKKLDNVTIYSKLAVTDTNFLRDFFFLSKLYSLWFNQKISILQVISDKKIYSRGKNSLIFFFGCTIRKNDVLKHLDYINNIIFNLSKKVDGFIKYKTINNGFIYSFSNINLLLGFKSERFFNLNLKINILYNFISKNTTLQKFEVSNKIINFYEKVFF